MARWAAFAGLTAVVSGLLLTLAHLSHQPVSDGDATAGGRTGEDERDPRDRQDRPAQGGRRARPERPHRRPPPADGADHPRAPVVPRFEATDGTATDGRPVPAADDALASLSTGALLVNVALTHGLFGGVLAAAALYFQIPADALGLSGSPFATSLEGVGLGVAFGVGLWLVNEAAGTLVEAADLGHDNALRNLLAPDTAAGWALLLGGVLPAVALVEEFIFRAAAVGAVSAGFPSVSSWALALVSSVAFGLAHGAQGRTGVVVTGALGFALATGFLLTGSLLVVVVAHYLVNALELVVHEGLGVDRPGTSAAD